MNESTIDVIQLRSPREKSGLHLFILSVSAPINQQAIFFIQLFASKDEPGWEPRHVL